MQASTIDQGKDIILLRSCWRYTKSSPPLNTTNVMVPCTKFAQTSICLECFGAEIRSQATYMALAKLTVTGADSSHQVNYN